MAVPFSLLKGTAFYSYELYCVTSNPKAARRAFDNIPVGRVMLPADHRRYPTPAIPTVPRCPYSDLNIRSRCERRA